MIPPQPPCTELASARWDYESSPRALTASSRLAYSYDPNTAHVHISAGSNPLIPYTLADWKEKKTIALYVLYAYAYVYCSAGLEWMTPEEKLGELEYRHQPPSRWHDGIGVIIRIIIGSEYEYSYEYTIVASHDQ